MPRIYAVKISLLVQTISDRKMSWKTPKAWHFSVQLKMSTSLKSLLVFGNIFLNWAVKRDRQIILRNKSNALRLDSSSHAFLLCPLFSAVYCKSEVQTNSFHLTIVCFTIARNYWLSSLCRFIPYNYTTMDPRSERRWETHAFSLKSAFLYPERRILLFSFCVSKNANCTIG